MNLLLLLALVAVALLVYENFFKEDSDRLDKNGYPVRRKRRKA